MDPKNDMPLVLSNSEGIPSTCTLKHIEILRNNVLVDHSNSLWRSLDSFRLRKLGTAKLGDIMTKEGNRLSGILKKHIKTGMEKCKADGFALKDIFIDKLVSSNEANCDTSKERNLFYSQDCTVMRDHSIKAPDPIQQIIPHKSVEEAMNILKQYGTITDVPGDGSCGYPSVMLLLRKFNLIPKHMSVYRF
jgi:hypothetical protein